MPHTHQSLADRRDKMRSRFGAGTFWFSRKTLDSFVTALAARITRPRNFIFLFLVVCVGYLLVVSSRNEQLIYNDLLPETTTPEIKVHKRKLLISFLNLSVNLIRFDRIQL